MHKCGKQTRLSPCLCADSRRGTWTGPHGSWPDETLPEGRRGSPKSDVRGQRLLQSARPVSGEDHVFMIMKIMWDELEVRLDIWHFMRRFAAGVTTEAHPLYGIFMARLSACIFQWDPEDVAALRRAKEGELAAKKTGHISERAVSARVTRRELALHCRRRTRGLEETTRSIGSLIDLFDSADGKDTLGVPLLDHERIQQIWKEQRKHVQCIQDPENFPLYMKTGRRKAVWSCARGSTSLASFHLHLNRFIPGITYI